MYMQGLLCHHMTCSGTTTKFITLTITYIFRLERQLIYYKVNVFVPALKLRVVILWQVVEPFWGSLDSWLFGILHWQMSISPELQIEMSVVTEPSLNRADNL